MSLRRRLVVGLLLGLIALLAVSGTLLYFYVKAVLVHQFDAALLAETDTICSLIKLQPNGDVEVDLPQEPIPQLGTARRPEYFQVWREDGTILVRSPALGESDLPFAPAAEKPVFTDIDLPQQCPGKVLLVRFVPVTEDEDVADSNVPKKPTVLPAQKRVIVAVAQDRSELYRIMKVLLSALLAVAALLAVGTVAVVGIVVRRGLLPLERVTYEAGQIDAHALDFRFSLEGLPNELRPICLRLNDSLDRLQQAFERQRRFTADAAHELRTPIAELRSLADVALRWDGDRETSLGYFKDAQEIAQQMESVVTTLLSLARCQSGEVTVVRESVDLTELVRQVWEGHQQEADDRHLDVSFVLPEQLSLETDRTMLCSMVNNLLANAAEYTKSEGKISCKVAATRSAVEIRVVNDVDCLSPDDLPHLRGAFWRKDLARTDGLHCGLGLTLVDAYATALDGKLELSMPKPDFLCVTLMLPIG